MRMSKVQVLIQGMLVAAMLLFFLLPIYWLLSTAFKFGRDAFATPPQWFFFHYTLENFRQLWQNSGTPGYLRNSIIISGGVTALSLLLGVPAGYALARSQSRLIAASSHLFLLLLMLPPIAMLIPFYLLMRQLHLLGSYAGLILLDTLFDASFVAWLMRSTFAEMPPAMEEAALVDGASVWQVFRKIALPLAWPGLSAAAIYCLIFSWNDFLFALMLTSPRTKTLPLGIMASFSAVEISWGRMAAMSFIAVLPPFFVALFLNRTWQATISQRSSPNS
jgi:multiple sugar transport system permease protein